MVDIFVVTGTADWSTGRSSTTTMSSSRPACSSLWNRDEVGHRRVPHRHSAWIASLRDYIWWLYNKGADALIDDSDTSYVFSGRRRRGPLRAAAGNRDPSTQA